MTSCWCGNTVLKEYSEDYHRCDVCHTLITKKIISEEIYAVSNESDDLYGANYWKETLLQMAGKKTLEEMIGYYLTDRAPYWMKYLLKYCLPPASIAEIGCGIGQFPYLVKQAGYQQVAYELSQEICSYINKTLNVNIVCGEISESDQAYDCVAAFDLIEHIISLEEFVSGIVNHIKEDGILCLQTPCYNPDMTYEEMLVTSPRFQDQLKSEQHIYLFSRNSMTKLLSQHGLLHIQFEPAVFGDDYDMFVFASRHPLKTYSREESFQALYQSDAGKLVDALLTVYDEKNEFITLYNTSETNYVKTSKKLETVINENIAAQANLEKQLYEKHQSQLKMEASWKVSDKNLQIEQHLHTLAKNDLLVIQSELASTEKTLSNYHSQLLLQQQLTRQQILANEQPKIDTRWTLFKRAAKPLKTVPLRIAVNTMDLSEKTAIEFLSPLLKELASEAKLELFVLCSFENYETFMSLDLASTHYVLLSNEQNQALYRQNLLSSNNIKVQLTFDRIPKYIEPGIPVVTLLSRGIPDNDPIVFHSSGILCMQKNTKNQIIAKYGYNKDYIVDASQNSHIRTLAYACSTLLSSVASLGEACITSLQNRVAGVSSDGLIEPIVIVSLCDALYTTLKIQIDTVKRTVETFQIKISTSDFNASYIMDQNSLELAIPISYQKEKIIIEISPSLTPENPTDILELGLLLKSLTLTKSDSSTQTLFLHANNG